MNDPSVVYIETQYNTFYFDKDKNLLDFIEPCAILPYIEASELQKKIPDSRIITLKEIVIKNSKNIRL
jgi:hypothetical protein